MFGGLFGSGGGSSIGIDEMTIGMSGSGMGDYTEMLRTKILTEMEDELNTQRDAIIKSVQSGWRGNSEEAFERLLRDQVERIVDDLEAEYGDLDNKLHNTSQYYIDQDAKLAETMSAGGE